MGEGPEPPSCRVIGSGTAFTESHTACWAPCTGHCGIPGVALQSWWGTGDQASFAAVEGGGMIVPCLLGLSAPTLPWLLDTSSGRGPRALVEWLPPQLWAGLALHYNRALWALLPGACGEPPHLDPSTCPAPCGAASLPFQLLLLSSREPGGLAWRDSGQARPLPPKDTGATGMSVAC